MKVINIFEALEKQEVSSTEKLHFDEETITWFKYKKHKFNHKYACTKCGQVIIHNDVVFGFGEHNNDMAVFCSSCLIKTLDLDEHTRRKLLMVML